MSFNFYLGGENFDRENWYQSVATHLRVNEASLLPATWEFGVDGDDPSSLSSRDLAAEAVWLLPRGGIRGVGFRPTEDDGGIEFVLATQASRKDFEWVEQLIKLGIECGAVATDEEEAALVLGENGPSQQFDKWWAFGRSAVKQAIENDDSGSVTLPIRHFGVSLTQEDLELDDAGLMAVLSERVERYASAFFPSLLGIEKGGKTAHIVVYSDRGTLIPPEVDGIAIIEADAHGIPDLVPLEAFVESMGELAEKAGSSWYVAECGFLSDASCYERFQGLPALSETDIPEREESAVESRSDGSEGETDESMEWLMKMPVYVFFLVAGADGKVDEKETKMLFALLQNASEAPSAVFAEGAGLLLQNAESVFPTIVSEEIPRLPIQLALAKAAMETVISDPEEKALYKLCLLTLAKEIASASGGGFLGLGSKISRAERRAIESLKELLEMPEFEI